MTRPAHNSHSQAGLPTEPGIAERATPLFLQAEIRSARGELRP
jgi:hypothetical protein